MNNGTSLMVSYWPNCDKKPDYSSTIGYVTGKTWICLNVVYDLNGLAKPNQVGKDIGFVSVIYPDENMKVVAPNMFKDRPNNTDSYNADSACKSLNKDLSVADLEEAIALGYNWETLIVYGNNAGGILSSTRVINRNRNYAISFTIANKTTYLRELDASAPIVCIKR